MGEEKRKGFRGKLIHFSSEVSLSDCEYESVVLWCWRREESNTDDFTICIKHEKMFFFYWFRASRITGGTSKIYLFSSVLPLENLTIVKFYINILNALFYRQFIKWTVRKKHSFGTFYTYLSFFAVPLIKNKCFNTCKNFKIIVLS